MSEAFIDFYNKNDWIPTRQDISNLEEHFSKRKSLLQQLGIVTKHIENSEILEIGPGSGENAIFTASLKPKRYVLMDFSKPSIRSLNEKKNQGLIPGFVEIIYQNIFEVDSEETFDIVWAEGVLPGQQYPEQFLQKAANLVRPGGNIVFTTCNSVSYLSEICRRSFYPYFREKFVNQSERIASLCEFFEPSIGGLKGRSRFSEDWVMDNIVHDWTRFGLFGIDDAFKTLDKNFFYHGGSPSLISDWRWYKAIPFSQVSELSLSGDYYNRVSPHLIDFRSNGLETFSEEFSLNVKKICDEALVLHGKWVLSSSQNNLDNFTECLRNISKIIENSFPLASEAIVECINALQDNLSKNCENMPLTQFHKWFGRGQQYICLTKI